MQPDAVARASEIREYLAVLKARKWTLAVIFALILGVVVTFSYRQTPIYQAQARVFVQPYPSGDGSSLAAPNLETERELVASEPVAERVAEDLGVDQAPRALLAGLSVEAVTETEVLNISYSSSDPDFARDGANAFARNYIEFRRDAALETIRSTRALLQERIKEVQDRTIETLAEFLDASERGDELEVRRLDAERAVLSTRLVTLQQRLDDVEPDSTVTDAGSRVIQQATLPSSPISPNLKRDLLWGGVLGLIVGVGTVFLRERLDDRFRGRTDVARITGAPVLATVPRFHTANGKVDPAPIAAVQPSSVASETYRTLRTNTDFAMLQHGFKSMLITSASAAEGKTATTANLGVAAAQAGSRVLLVSTDLRRPALEKYFGVANRAGVSTFLVGDNDDMSSLIHSTPIPNLRVFPSGPVPPNPAELLASERLGRLLWELEEGWDLVLLDSPPTLPVADAMILASRARTTLLVVNAMKTRRSAAAHAKERLESVGSQLIGTVLNAFDPATSPYYYDAYYYYYDRLPAAPPAQTTNGNPSGRTPMDALRDPRR